MGYYINLATGRFPMAVSDIKVENPDTSYPKGCTAFDGYTAVPDPTEPTYDRMTQRLVLVPPTLGSLVYAYRAEPMSEQEIADNITNKILQENQASNDHIIAELAANDLKIVRALTEGDTVRIDAHKADQAALRAKIK